MRVAIRAAAPAVSAAVASLVLAGPAAAATAVEYGLLVGLIAV